MKYHILILLTICSLFELSAQKKGKQEQLVIPFDSTTNKYTYTQVTEVAGKDAAALYKLAKDWCIQAYTKEVFLIDKPNDQLSQLGSFSINITMRGGMIKVPFVYTVTYNINSRFKDGKARVQITNIKLTQNAQGNVEEQTMESFEKQMESMGMGKNIAAAFVDDTFAEIDKNIQATLSQIDAYLKGEKKDSDW